MSAEGLPARVAHVRVVRGELGIGLVDKHIELRNKNNHEEYVYSKDKRQELMPADMKIEVKCQSIRTPAYV